MKQITLFFLGLMLVIQASCQEPGQTFDKIANFKAGLITTETKYADGTTQKTAFTGQSGNMIYPGSGIPISNGTSWGLSIVNNSVNWNTAYGWGNHAGLYRPLTWKPDWNTDLLNKPVQKPLKEAIPLLDYLPIPRKTTAEINALVMPPDVSGVIFDKTLMIYKFYLNGTWVNNITGQ